MKYQVLQCPMQNSSSPLTEGRGLKLNLVNMDIPVFLVAPHGGAWIEIESYHIFHNCFVVAPHGGAWIEMFAYGSPLAQSMSPLTEGRGLKFRRGNGQQQVRRSPLTEGRGLKCPDGSCWVRAAWSPLTEGRGLKCDNRWYGKPHQTVAPHGGAWIEMRSVKRNCCRIWSPLTEGRGLKSDANRRRFNAVPSPLTEGRGLK